MVEVGEDRVRSAAVDWEGELDLGRRPNLKASRKEMVCASPENLEQSLAT